MMLRDVIRELMDAAGTSASLDQDILAAQDDATGTLYAIQGCARNPDGIEVIVFGPAVQ
jgi:hypothetical protein